MQPNEITAALSEQASSSSSSSSTSTSTSISLLPSEPLPWRPNTRTRLPPGALLDIDQGPLWDIITEWLPFESVCHLDSALCNKSRRPEFLELLATQVLLFNREEVKILTDPYRTYALTHIALGAAALNWVLRRGIHLASLHLPLSPEINPTEQQGIREAVAALAFNGSFDKLETVSLYSINYIKDADFTAVLSKSYKSMESINLRECGGLTKSAAAHIKRCTKLEALAVYGNESAADMAEIFQACRKLRKVDLSAFEDRLNDEVVLSVADHCPLLEHFYLNGCDDAVSDEAIRRVAESCPQLRFVDLFRTSITDATVVSLCNHCTHLKRMYFEKCYKLTDAAVLAVAERLPGLTHINIFAIRAITSSAVETLASKCHELEYIDLNCCYIVSDAAVIKITEFCSKLRDLRVARCTLLTDAAVLAVAERLPGLKRIHLRDTAAITSSALETLASKCHELEFINLSDSPNVSDATLLKIAEHCSKLEVLDVTGCPKVTAVGVAEIRSKCLSLKTFDFDLQEDEVEEDDKENEDEDENEDDDEDEDEDEDEEEEADDGDDEH